MPSVQRRLKGIDGPGVRAVWMRGMASGDAASYNAGARFTAASTLKLGILMTSLAHNSRNPVNGPVWGAYKRMVLDSDNASANSVEVQMGGSTSGGSAMVNAFCRRLGCRDTDMYGGYIPNTGRRAIRPVRGAPTAGVARGRRRRCHRCGPSAAPSIGTYGKHTTAHDLGVLAAGAGRGRRRPRQGAAAGHLAGTRRGSRSTC